MVSGQIGKYIYLPILRTIVVKLKCGPGVQEEGWVGSFTSDYLL